MKLPLKLLVLFIFVSGCGKFSTKNYWSSVRGGESQENDFSRAEYREKEDPEYVPLPDIKVNEEEDQYYRRHPVLTPSMTPKSETNASTTGQLSKEGNTPNGESSSDSTSVNNEGVNSINEEQKKKEQLEWQKQWNTDSDSKSAYEGFDLDPRTHSKLRVETNTPKTQTPKKDTAKDSQEKKQKLNTEDLRQQQAKENNQDQQKSDARSDQKATEDKEKSEEKSQEKTIEEKEETKQAVGKKQTKEQAPAEQKKDAPTSQPKSRENQRAETGDNQKDNQDDNRKEEQPKGRFGGYVKPTIYGFTTINEDREGCDSNERDVYDKNGRVMARICAKSYNICALQGSCMVIQNGKKLGLNIWHKINGQERFFSLNGSKCPNGFGSSGVCLDPFYSLAADLNTGLYGIGDVIYIPQVRGLMLPNGQRHNGYFIIRDKGSAIKGVGRFDFYTGEYDWRDPRNPFAKINLQSQSTRIPFYIVQGRVHDLVQKFRNY